MQADEQQNDKELLLFDIDGVLTLAKQKIDTKTINVLKQASLLFDLSFVSGTDKKCLDEQLKDVIDLFKYKFYENATQLYIQDKCEYSLNMQHYLGQNEFQNLLQLIKEEIDQIQIENKTGNHIEIRNGLLNVSPQGIKCSQELRQKFIQINKEKNILNILQQRLQQKFSNLNVAQGGQISLDIFPKEWNKSLCLKILLPNYNKIIFFGDKCNPGENDYCIYSYQDPKLKSFHIKKGPEETQEILQDLIKEKQLNKQTSL